MLSLLASAPSQASCNFVPGAENVFRASSSSLDRPFGTPGFPVVVQLDLEGCEMSAGAGFVDQDNDGRADDDFAVVLLFTPPNGPASAVVVHDVDDPNACVGFGGSASQSSCENELPVLGNGIPGSPTQASCLPGAIDVVDASTLQFTFPDTASLVGSSAPAGATLAGPGKLAVLPRTATDLPCELAQSGQRCATDSPTGLLACVDEFYERNDTCSTDASNRLTSFQGFTALPRWNDYEAMCVQENGSPCDGLQPTARFTVDETGNLLIPINWGGVLVRLDDGTPVPRLINLTTALPAFDGSPAPIRVPGPSFSAALSPEGHFLPPIFSPFAEEQGGNPVLFGSVDAEFSVTRINQRGSDLEWCVGGAFDGEPCNESSECEGGGSCQPSVCHVAQTPGTRPLPVSGPAIPCSSDADCTAVGGQCGPSLFDFATRFSGEGCGPALDDSYVASSGSLVPLESLFTQQSDEILALPRVEAIEASEGNAADADFNQDGDEQDVSITLVNRETGAEQRIGLGALGAPGVAVTQVREGPYRFSALAVEENFLAFLQDERSDFQTDWSGNGRVQDSVLRVYERASDDSVPNLPIGGGFAVDAAPVINGLSLVIDDGLVFFRVSEADEGNRGTVASSTDEAGNTPTSYDSGFASDFLDTSRERGAMSSDGRFIVFDTTANAIDPDLPGGDTNARRDVYLIDRDADGNGLYDEFSGIEIELISRKTDGSLGDADSGTTFLRGADVSNDGRYVVFPSRANLDDAFPDDFVSDMFLRDRTAGTTTQITTGACKPTSDNDPENPVISNDGSTIAFEIDPQEGGIPYICVYDIASNTVEAEVVAAFSPSLSYDGKLLAFVTFLDLDFLDDDDQMQDAYVLDRESGEVDWVSPIGPSEDVHGTSMSDDGRFVAFTTEGNHDSRDLPASNDSDPYVFDRETRSLRFVDLTTVLSTDPSPFPAVGGPTLIPTNLAAAQGKARLSPDGRYLATLNAVENQSGAIFPSYALVTDLSTSLTRFASVNSANVAYPVNQSGTDYPSISERGLHTGFASTETAFVFDANATKLDTFVNGIQTIPAPSYGASDGDFNEDEDLDDVFLYAIDARNDPGFARRIGPASVVSVAGGNAAFLCREASDASDPVDGNGDGDFADTNVCYWPNRLDDESGPLVDNLGQDAKELDSSQSRIAARVAGSSAATVVEVYDIAGTQTWQAVTDAAGAPQTSDALCGVSGDAVAFTTRESEQGRDFNGDGAQLGRYTQIWDAANGALFDVALSTEYCEVGPAGGICVGPPAGLCASDAECPESEFCDVDAGACRGFGDLCETVADCGAGESCFNGSIIGVATDEATECTSTALFCESAQALGCGCDLNGDGDCCDFDEAFGLLDCNPMDFCQALPAIPGCSACDLNGDGDCCDDVLQAYDTATRRLTNCAQAVVPCVEAACDPRERFRVEANQIRFLTQECDQGTGDLIASPECSLDGESNENGGDLNRNGVTGELIVQICDGRTGEITVVGAIEEGEETNGDPLAGGGGGTAFLGRGVCVQRFETSSCGDPLALASSGDCPEDQFCDLFDPGDLVCAQTLGTCHTDADCTVGSFCRLDPVLAASGDMDGDQVSDAFDNCETTPNPTQGDVDRDGIGNACDLTTCGNGILENDEACDDGNLVDADGCSSKCIVDVPAPLLCDANDDRFIDRRDIHQITLANGTAVGAQDPRDFDGNGVLNIFDARGCTFLCDRANCDMPRSCGLVGFELLLVAMPALRRRLRRTRVRTPR